MPSHDVLVIGGWISGASFAFHAAQSGRKVLVVEREASAGGCLCSTRSLQDFWYELGAHTCYNSYRAFLEILEGCDLLGELQARGKPVLRFLDGDQLVAGTNLPLMLKLFRKSELLRALPRWLGASQDGQTVRSYYSRLVGPGNYARVLGPMLSAVPSQTADLFPANMLFKKRERRKDVMRSFTLPGGLQTAVETALARPGIEVATGRTVVEVERSSGRFVVKLDDGWRTEADVLAVAVSPGVAASLLGGLAPDLAARVARIGEVRVDSLGFALPKEMSSVPLATFLIPLKDEFHSVVTRDVVPDPERRGFTFHFRPGHTREERIRRASQILRIRPEAMQGITERSWLLPSPVLGHAEQIDEIDRLLAGGKLALTGNWFEGLSIEDCVTRSRAEWGRVAGHG